MLTMPCPSPARQSPHLRSGLGGKRLSSISWHRLQPVLAAPRSPLPLSAGLGPSLSIQDAPEARVLHRCVHFRRHASARAIAAAIRVVAQERPALDHSLVGAGLLRIVACLRTPRI